MLLQGSRLESGLESLARGAAGAGPGPGPAAGSGAAEGDGGGALAALRRRFGAVAAAVLEAWRQGTAVPLGRWGGQRERGGAKVDTVRKRDSHSDP